MVGLTRLAALAALVAFATGLAAAPAAPSPVGVTGQAQARQGTASGGRIISVAWTPQPPTFTPEQLQELQRAQARANRSPSIPGPIAEVPSTVTKGPETLPLPPARNGPGVNAAGDFRVFRNTVIPGSGISGAYSHSSFTGEPSTGVNGRNIFQTGNWYATRSFDNGTSWSYLNPYAIFGSGFCCDQVTLYDPGRDIVFWLLQYDGPDHLVLAVARGGDLTSWCSYVISPGWFGHPSTTDMDYNEMALGRAFLYVTTNLYPTSGSPGAGLLRLPIDELASCAGFGYAYLTWPGSLHWVPVAGANHGTMYWGSNWNLDLTFGSKFRVFSLAENSGTVFWTDRTIDAFTWQARGSGRCGSPSGVVANWCQYNDSRVKSGALVWGTLIFAFDVRQGSGYPFPYARRVYFRESDKVYLGKADQWASWTAIQYYEIAPNVRGDLGFLYAWGGGTKARDDYPGLAIGITDDFAPAAPWDVYLILPGGGNTCNPGSGYRWGDYLTVRPFDPAAELWVAAGYIMRGGDCGAGGHAEPHNIVFGRVRDAGSYDRWRNR